MSGGASNGPSLHFLDPPPLSYSRRPDSFCVFSFPFPILIILNTKLEGKTYHFIKFSMTRPTFESTTAKQML